MRQREERNFKVDERILLNLDARATTKSSLLKVDIVCCCCVKLDNDIASVLVDPTLPASVAYSI